MPPLTPHDDYAVVAMYSVADEAWHLELEHVAVQHHLATAVVPDEDPAREPTVRFHTAGGRAEVPCEVLRWFVDQVDAEIRDSRAWMQLGPELVEVIRRLRQEYGGAIDDEDFPQVLAELRATLPEADLPAVLAAAFGCEPDGAAEDARAGGN
ncbi:hypothetical protein ACIPW5_05140 [Streptomyces sp. NPDC090077]|uniref:hypothetical protein n=1 Tax=Streptomyces sp. NPDC090077 TaxID=3365938 RepID=UPI00382F96EB